jgi:hypothetical protein
MVAMFVSVHDEAGGEIQFHLLSHCHPFGTIMQCDYQNAEPLVKLTAYHGLHYAVAI